MFIGSLVFFLSAIVIIGKTSLPVFNKIFGYKIAPPEDAEFAYNSIQVYVAIIIGVLTAIVQYLKYKKTTAKFFLEKNIDTDYHCCYCSYAGTCLWQYQLHKKGPDFLALSGWPLPAAIYAIVANAAYIWLGIKGKLKLSGGSVAHVGFGMVLLGILISSSKKEVLSNNKTGYSCTVGSQ